METLVGVLVRISDDRLGEEKGVQRQLADCRRLAKQRGWVVAEVYEENDTSAFKRRMVVLPDGSKAMRVVRPEYRRLLDDLSSGRLAGLVAYDLDRVARDPRDLEDLIDVVESRSLATASVTGSLDLSTDAGVFMARMMVNVANKSSRDTARRVKRKLEENAAEGKHHGGHRPYGWDDDRVTLRPAEADVVRQAAAAVLAGRSIKSIVRDLNEAGACTAQGRPWSDVLVRDMLCRPRNAGLRVHQGEVHGKGAFAAILDHDTWQQVLRLLTDPGRRTTPGGSGRTHLLSGIARCGECGGPMRVAKGKPYVYKGELRAPARDIYRCKGEGQCLSRDLLSTDLHVEGYVLARLSQPDALDLLEDPDDPGAREAAEEARRLRGRLDQAAADYAEGLIDSEQLRIISARLRPQVEAQERRACAGSVRPRALEALLSDGPAHVVESWLRLDVAQRRTIVAELVEVTVLKTARGPGFKPESVVVGMKKG